MKNWISALLKNPLKWLAISLLVAFVLWVLVIKYESLADQYGTKTSESSQVTNPVGPLVILNQAIAICNQYRNNEPNRCKQAIEGIGDRIGQEDLKAQQSMARSALGIVHLNLLQIVLNGLLFGAVGWTLYETRKGATAAVKTNDSNIEHTRGKLAVLIAKHFPRGTVTELGQPTGERIHFYIRNIGNDVAYCNFVTGGIKKTQTEDDFFINDGDWKHDGDRVTHIFPVEHTEKDRKGILFNIDPPEFLLCQPHDEDELFCWCIIEYTDSYGISRRSTSTFRSLGFRNGDRIAFGPYNFTDEELKK